MFPIRPGTEMRGRTVFCAARVFFFEFAIPLCLRAWARLRRRNSTAQSQLSEVVLDDSRQHVLDYVPLFSWCDSNATWQCQQHCFLQQKE